MDGNNRWSKKKNVQKIDAYKKGAKNLISLSKYLFDKYNIKNLSAFALSSHNLKRTNNFTTIFISVLEYFLLEFEKFNINFKIKFIGNLTFIRNKKLIESLNNIEKNNSKSRYTLTIFINYSGTLDIINAAKNYHLNNQKQKFSDLLSTNILPDPDMLIRSGGYKRISDFMLFEISFTDLFFSNKLWPDLNNRDIDRFMNKFSKIERKFGI